MDEMEMWGWEGGGEKNWRSGGEGGGGEVRREGGEGCRWGDGEG